MFDQPKYRPLAASGFFRRRALGTADSSGYVHLRCQPVQGTPSSEGLQMELRRHDPGAGGRRRSSTGAAIASTFIAVPVTAAWETDMA